jgi:hypothetical protein
MFTIDEPVINQKTGQLGKVIGYGHQIINNVYTVTLMVLVAQPANGNKVLVVEDPIHAWNHWSVA